MSSAHNCKLKGQLLAVRQRNASECGLACTLWTLRLLGTPVTYGQLVQFLRAGRDGNSLRDLSRTFREYGVECKGYRGALEAFSASTPFIAHWENQHFVVVYDIKVDCDTVKIMDPACGYRSLSMSEAEHEFQGVGLVVESYSSPSYRERGRFLLQQWKIVGGLFKKNRSSLSLLCILALGTGGLSLVPSFLVSILVDHATGYRGGPLGLYLLLFAVILLIYGVLSYLKGVLQAKLGLRITEDVSSKLAARLFSISFSAVERIGPSEMLVKVQSIFQLRDAIGNRIVPMLTDGIVCVVSGVVLAMVSPAHFAVASAIFFGVLALYASTARNAYKLSLETLDSGEQANNQLVSALANIYRAKAEGEDVKNERDWIERNGRFLDAIYAREVFDVRVQFPQTILLYATPVLFFLIGLLLVNYGTMTIGDAVGVATLSQVFIHPATQFGINLQQLFGINASLERINDLFLEAPEGAYWKGDQQISSFEKLSVGHSGNELDERYVRIPRVKFDVGPDDMVALVGSSGSGKSTVLASILGLAGPPPPGSVKVNGINLDELDIVSWRQRISFLPQSYLPDSGSIRDIVRGDTGLVDSEVWEILDQVGLRQEVQRFPLGLSTVVGGDEARLSGGQLKRLGLARAIGKSPLLLVLDEPTDSLPDYQADDIFSLLKDINTPVVVATHYGGASRFASSLVEFNP